MQHSLKGRIELWIAGIWISFMLSGYYLQFFQSRAWHEHAMPFLNTLIK